MTIGVDLGATQIRAAICQGDRLEHKRQTLLENKDVLEKTLDQISDFLSPLINSNTDGIGIGVPAVVDIPTGIVYNSNNISSWKRVELKRELEMRFGLPVHVNNDANCFAYGTYKYGLEDPCENMVGITLGTGIGIGLVLNGRPYFGSNCGAGELGILRYLDARYEDFSSSGFFVTQHQTTAQAANEAAAGGDGEVTEVWREYGDHLGQFVKMVLAAYDPEVIAFGGSISKAFPLFEGDLKSALSDFPFPETVRRLKLVTMDQQDLAILGAAALWDEYERLDRSALDWKRRSEITHP